MTFCPYSPVIEGQKPPLSILAPPHNIGKNPGEAVGELSRGLPERTLDWKSEDLGSSPDDVALSKSCTASEHFFRGEMGQRPPVVPLPHAQEAAHGGALPQLCIRAPGFKSLVHSFLLGNLGPAVSPPWAPVFSPENGTDLGTNHMVLLWGVNTEPMYEGH